MYQGTTPALIFRVKGKDLTEATVFVSIQTGTRVTTKTGDDLTVTLDDEDSLVVCQLTQEDTLAMSAGEGDAQIRFISESGNSETTKKAKITVNDVIYKKIISYAGDGEA